MLTWIWIIMAAGAVLAACAAGRTDALAPALTEGAGGAVTLVISLCGVICLWTGVMEVMKRAGLTDKLSRLMSPALDFLFPDASVKARAAISANISANLLGLGNAATPPGLLAAKELQRNAGTTAGNGFCTLAVINTASLQLIPMTMAAVRAANGASAPFDIMPLVWVTSACSVTLAVISAKAFSKATR